MKYKDISKNVSLGILFYHKMKVFCLIKKVGMFFINFWNDVNYGLITSSSFFFFALKSV